MESALLYLSLVGAVIALLFTLLQVIKVNKSDEGNEDVRRISGAIKSGANAYLIRQYKGVGIFFGLAFIILMILYFLEYITIFIPFSFITGGFLSALTGYAGMKIATGSNGRTATAAIKSLNSALKIAFSAGSVMGFTVVGVGLLYITVWYIILNFALKGNLNAISSCMVTLGMGASSMALFARVGGGIFTKAADVGADLVGKVEAGIPEDDPRNPAVIADNVGDNVGDVAGMGADLFESYVGAIISTSALAVSASLSFKGMLLPLALAAVGIISSVIGSFFVRTKENATQKSLLFSLRKGVYVSGGLIAILAFLLIYYALGKNGLGLYVSVITGLISGIAIGIFTEYFTSDTYKPTKKLAETSQSGTAPLIISGLSVGMISTFLPVLTIGVTVLISFFIGGGLNNFSMGLYSIGLAAVGMLSTLGITLATDAYGPIADNAGGIAEMTKLPEYVRERTDALDSLGNTTAATGKGFAVGSAALTALVLISAYVEQIALICKNIGEDFSKFNFSLTNPVVMIGLFIGGMLPFLFSSLTMDAVSKAAMSIVNEVRRQFREMSGIMENKVAPDYEKCVDICTRSAQKEMLFPAIITIATPIVTGFVLGVTGVVGLLVGATVSGFVLAVMMANSGGAWDNAKKYIEQGNLGGKGSDCHKAAVIGDTVGDPFKDTAGPSINILIKLISMVSIAVASMIVTNSLIH